MAVDPPIGPARRRNRIRRKKEAMTEVAIFGLGVPELLIILAVVLLLFGGSRLAGLGKSTGRALKEFKEETKGLKGENAESEQIGGSTAQPPTGQPGQPGPPSPVRRPQGRLTPVPTR
jgi:sec-independent protein translocase protein TatA